MDPVTSFIHRFVPVNPIDTLLTVKQYLCDARFIAAPILVVGQKGTLRRQTIFHIPTAGTEIDAVSIRESCNDLCTSFFYSRPGFWNGIEVVNICNHPCLYEHIHVRKYNWGRGIKWHFKEFSIFTKETGSRTYDFVKSHGQTVDLRPAANGFMKRFEPTTIPWGLRITASSLKDCRRIALLMG